MRFLRSFALVLALAFLILPAAPLGGVVPIPTVGGDAAAMYGCDYRDWQCLDEKDDWDTDGGGTPDMYEPPTQEECYAGAFAWGAVGGVLSKAGGTNVIGWLGYGIVIGAGATAAFVCPNL